MRAAAGAPLSNTAVWTGAAVAAATVLVLAVFEPRIACSEPDVPFARPSFSVPRVLVLGAVAGGAAGAAAWWCRV